MEGTGLTHNATILCLKDPQFQPHTRLLEVHQKCTYNSTVSTQPSDTTMRLPQVALHPYNYAPFHLTHHLGMPTAPPPTFQNSTATYPLVSLRTQIQYCLPLNCLTDRASFLRFSQLKISTFRAQRLHQHVDGPTHIFAIHKLAALLEQY